MSCSHTTRRNALSFLSKAKPREAARPPRWFALPTPTWIRMMGRKNLLSANPASAAILGGNPMQRLELEAAAKSRRLESWQG